MKFQLINWMLLMGLLLMCCSFFGNEAQAVEQQAEKPRIIATTDGEIDDRCSMVRFLMNANEWDIEGIIHCSSRFHWAGGTISDGQQVEARSWEPIEWLDRQIDAYEQVYDNLKIHAEGFPTADELRSKVFVGNIVNVGEMELDTPGARRIVEVLLDDEPGPVYLQAWGGTNTIARALKIIQDEYPEQIEKVSGKAIIYIILDQDSTYRDYIQPNWPEIQVLYSRNQFWTIAYGWARSIPEPHLSLFQADWMNTFIRVGCGPLTAEYPYGRGGGGGASSGAFISEGDSPSFMYQIDVGLRSLESPFYGGWGGRFEKTEGAPNNHWDNATDDDNMGKPIWRWATAFQNDWAARAMWCVATRYEQSNHPPVVQLSGENDIEAAPGTDITLDVSQSGDPDAGQQLNYSWWQYSEPGTYNGMVEIENTSEAVATVNVPSDAKAGDTIHIIAEVTDSGIIPLTRYTRVIITVK